MCSVRKLLIEVQRLIFRLRQVFVRGILLILPLAMTLLILHWLFKIVTGLSTPGAERILRSVGSPPMILSILTPFISIVISVGVVVLVGLVGGNYVGKRILTGVENLLMRLPLVRWFYSSSRQLIDAFRYSGGAAFREVVLVEYPRRGIWCIGFVTAPATELMKDHGGQEFLYVFLPTTPNPTSGYTIVVPRAEARMAGMSVEQGLKLIFSGGFIAPASGGDGTPVPEGNSGG